MDTIAFGLLGAYIHTYYGEQWNKSKNWTFLLGLSLLTAINVFETTNYIYLQTVYFSITGISIALLLPKLSNLTLKKAKFQPIQYLSKISYSIYLVQLPVFHILTHQAHGRLSDSELFILFILITIFFSAMIYHFYEKPIMKLRDRAFFTIT